jgi:hypothetical protein
MSIWEYVNDVSHRCLRSPALIVVNQHRLLLVQVSGPAPPADQRKVRGSTMATILRGKNPREPHTVRYQDNGRQRERSFRTAGEARDFVAEFEHDSRCGIFVDPSKGRADFCAAVEQWTARHPGNAGTKANYRAIYRAHIGPAFAGRTLAQVSQDRAAVQDFLTVTMPGKVCQARVGAARGIILGVIGEAVKAGHIPRFTVSAISRLRRLAGRPVNSSTPATRKCPASRPVCAGVISRWLCG